MKGLDVRQFLVIALSIFSASIGGCQHESGYPCTTVKGLVSVDGSPVPTGQITFSPVAQGPVVGAEIRNGAYRCEKVPIGKHHVTLIANSATPAIITDIVTGAKHEVPRSILPPHNRSGLDVEVDVSTATLDFPLRSRP